MLYRGKEIIGCKLVGHDGDVGSVKDVYFDDRTWQVRYVVVKTGGWLTGREVLLAPSTIVGIDAGQGALQVALTQKQVEDSPPVSSDMPVSRQYEQRLYDHYGWTPYWTYPLYTAPSLYMFPYVPMAGAAPVGLPDTEEARREQEAVLGTNQLDGDPHLRSYVEVKSYGIMATDGHIGHTDDMLLDPEMWRFTHLLIDTRDWLPGKHVVADVAMIQAINWDQESVEVSLSKQEVKDAPEYDPEMLIDEDYQAALSGYYRRLHEARRPAFGHEVTGDV